MTTYQLNPSTTFPTVATAPAPRKPHRNSNETRADPTLTAAIAPVHVSLNLEAELGGHLDGPLDKPHRDAAGGAGEAGGGNGSLTPRWAGIVSTARRGGRCGSSTG